MTTIKVHNVETGEEIQRDMNAEELAQWQANQEAEAARAEAEATKAADKAALLAKLGISESEAKLLLS
jgi:hypothetical protein